MISLFNPFSFHQAILVDFVKYLSLPQTDTQAKYPTCGIVLDAKSSRGKEKTGKAIGWIPPQKKGRPHVSAILPQDRHFRFNPPPARAGRTKRDFKDPGTALRAVQVQHIGSV